jgi:hypothetical protein
MDFASYFLINAFNLAEETLPKAVAIRHFDGMELEKIEMGFESGRRAPCRHRRHSLHEGKSVPAKEAAEAIRETGRLE